MLFKFLNEENNILTLPKEPLASKIKGASELEIKVLLYSALIASEKGVFSENDIQTLSGFDLTDIIIALQFWRGAEVLSISTGDEKQPPTPNASNNTKQALQKNDIPTYSGEEIDKLFCKNPDIKLLIDECQNIAGKIFNPHEINKIVSLYDYLGLSCEYILSIYNYCKRKNKTTVHYIEKTAFNLYNEGIDTDEKLQEYLKNKEAFESVAGNIRRIFGLGARSFTKKEESLIEKWTNTYSFSLDMIEYAYELTVDSIGKASLSYAGKIMENWFLNGIKTLDEAKQADIEHKKNNNPQDNNNLKSSFDTDEFFEAALKRSYDNIRKQIDN